MRILWVKPGKILPPDTGGKLRSYNILRHLSARHEVTYLSYYNGARDKKYEREIRQRLPGAVPVCTAAAETTGVRRCVDYVRQFRQSAPYAVSRFSSPVVQTMVAEWMAQRRFDVAVCDFLASAPNFPQDLTTPTVLFQHNVESVLWKRRSQFAVDWVHRIISNAESAKMVRYETEQVRRFDHVLAVSEYDRQAMSGMRDPSRISVLPTGVDLARYHYDPESRPVGPLVVFVGSMDWEPNIDGMEYFCRDIWPRVLAQNPGAIFRIVGRNPHRRVRALASESVTVTGTVPSVVEPLREAAVVVVPLRMGGGTRIKIYEGMAMGKATVSTSVGAEGLDVHHERDILLADDPYEFAEHVVSLLQNDDLRRRYESAAAMAVRDYDWSVTADLFVKQLEENVPSIAADRELAMPAA